MICIECMQDKKNDEYSIVHYVINPEELKSFRENPEKFKGNYCICNVCVNSTKVYPSLNLIN